MSKIKRWGKEEKMSSRYQATSVELLPMWEATIEMKTRIKNLAKEGLLRKATAELNLPPEKLIARGVLASDLDLESWVTPELRAGERTEWVDCTTSDSRFIGITKLTIIGDNPILSTLRFEIGNSMKGIFDLDELYDLLPDIKELSDIDCSKAMLYQFGGLENLTMQAYLPSVFAIPQNCKLGIDISAIQDSPGEHLVLSGIVVEPRGLKISP